MKTLFIVLFLPLMLLIGCKSEKEKMITLGDKKFMNNDYVGAAKIYNEVKKKHPDYLPAYIRLANCELCVSKNYPAFLGKLNQGAEANKQFGLYLNNYKYTTNNGFVSYTEEERRTKLLEFSNEIEFLTEAVSKNENNYLFYYARGIWYYLLDQPEKALDDFKIAVKKNPNALEAKLMNARIYSRYFKGRRGSFYASDLRNQYKALKLYIDILETKPTNQDIIVETVSSLNAAGQRLAALEILEEQYKKDTSNTNVLWNLAWQYRMLGQYKDAIKHINKLQEKYPNNKEYLEDMGYMLIDTGEKEKGIKTFRKVLEMVKNDKYESLRIQSLIDVYSIDKKVKL